MSYTHYWGFNPAKRGKAEETEKLYQKAIADCNKIIARWQRENKKGSDTDSHRLSGYSAHTNGRYGGLEINGKGELSHESFTMREHYSENDTDFCKTAAKPYDTVVVACLCVLKHRLGSLFVVSSDGDSLDWSDGLIYAQKATRLKIKNPIAPSKKLRAV